MKTHTSKLSRRNLVILAVLIIVIVLGVLLYTQFLKGFLAGYGTAKAPEGALATIELPEGFAIDYYASDVPNARSLAISERGIAYVGSRTAGNVYALIPNRLGTRAEKTITLVRGLNNPNGVAIKNGNLYVAEINRIIVFENIDARVYDENISYEVVFDNYPLDTHHGWKYIAFGPDGLLYVPVGAPCNACERADPYAAITRLDVDNPSKGYEVVARGVRNTVGFTWHPFTEEMWFTDNGRDWLGDDEPVDELNKLTRIGSHYGFPYCNEDSAIDPEHGTGKDCSNYVEPEQLLGPHVAALGLKFGFESNFPEKYKNGLFIAEHGSWNRRDPIGYRITYVPLTGNNASGYEVFAQGWLDGAQSWGRPVDVLFMPDGSMLVSDDKAGAVYRISYEK